MASFKKLTALMGLWALLGLSGLSAFENLAHPALSPEKAFALKATLLNPTLIELHFSIAPHHLLYKKHLHFKTLDGRPLKPLSLPPARVKKEAGNPKADEVYDQTLQIQIPFKAPGLKVEYQGCKEEGLCYSPLSKEVRIVKGVLHITDARLPEIEKPPLDKCGSYFHQLKTRPFLTLMLFFMAGLLLSLTPCILPMVPILAHILMGQAHPQKRLPVLATVYILSMALCYALAGVSAALIGHQWHLVLQHPICLTALSFLLVLLALDQIGILHIQLPSLLSRMPFRRHQGSLLGAFLLGNASALMLSPCVTPALVGALTYISQTQNALLGGAALFCLALGMGAPLLGLAYGSRWLPEKGPWMKKIRLLMGLLLLGLAFSLLQRAFPSHPSGSAVPLFTQIHSPQDFNQALQKAQGRPILLKISARWCASCQKMEQAVLNQPEVQQALQPLCLLELDLTRPTEAEKTLIQHFHIVGPPTLLFFSPKGQEQRHYRVSGEMKLNSFMAHLDQFLSQFSNNW